MERGVGVRFIVGYKLGKAGVELALGILLLALSRRVTNELHTLAEVLREHALGAWSLLLSERITSFATRQHVVFVGVAALLDAALSFIEGWALHRRYRWSRWLIVGATSVLLPFEIVSLARHLTIGRALVLVVNAWIVAYLVTRPVHGSHPPKNVL